MLVYFLRQIMHFFGACICSVQCTVYTKYCYWKSICGIFGEANFEAQTCRPIVTFEHGAYATYLYSAKVPGTGSCIGGQEAILSRQGLTLKIGAPSWFAAYARSCTLALPAAELPLHILHNAYCTYCTYCKYCTFHISYCTYFALQCITIAICNICTIYLCLIM